MSKFHVIVTNKTKMRRNKPGEFRMEFKSRKAFENAKAAICLFIKGGTTDENFYNNFNVDYCGGSQKELLILHK